MRRNLVATGGLGIHDVRSLLHLSAPSPVRCHLPSSRALRNVLAAISALLSRNFQLTRSRIRLSSLPTSSSSYRHIRIPPPSTDRVQKLLNVRPHDRDIAREASHGREEVPKEDKDPVQLDQESRERPPQQDQQDPCRERCRALEFLFPGEEEQGLLGADDEGQTDEEQDLKSIMCQARPFLIQ